MRRALAFLAASLFLLSLCGCASHEVVTATVVPRPAPPPKAYVIDIWRGNDVDWNVLAASGWILGVIHKASEGIKEDPRYRRQKLEAKTRGFKWGSYHVGRPGDPITQADLYLAVAQPGPDDLMALDLEDVHSRKFMDLNAAQAFIARIFEKTGRYPLIYGNHKTISRITALYGRDSVFARTPLWYARYREEPPEIPPGVWDDYLLWQFVSEINCFPEPGDCPLRVPGTDRAVDVNVFRGDRQTLLRRWPFS